MDKRRELNPDEHFQAKQSPGLKETKRCCILTKIALFKPKIAEQLETKGSGERFVTNLDLGFLFNPPL